MVLKGIQFPQKQCHPGRKEIPPKQTAGGFPSFSLLRSKPTVLTGNSYTMQYQKHEETISTVTGSQQGNHE